VHVEPHLVPLAPYWHLPAPSHLPVVPQVVFESVQVLWPTWPAGTARHCPSVCPFRSFVHAEHPVQSLSQQTPSATTPDVHWEPDDAAFPLESFEAQVLVAESQ
jgi:hypothetical protein